ncbi:MAG: hypothetical protein Ct9H300mP31_12310 [Acidimicrobiaceae bacterium]|nr:MAG: hypothetical protein Ct9H300mP31_12310 [Acidimicrobiaceae bacterium]
MTLLSVTDLTVTFDEFTAVDRRVSPSSLVRHWVWLESQVPASRSPRFQSCG